MGNIRTIYMCDKLKLLRSKAEKTFYFTFARSDKKYKPYDEDGLRYQLNLETGELRPYRKSEIIKNITKSVGSSRALLQDLLDMNQFDWFLTLTFDDCAVDRFDDDAVDKACQKYLENMRKQYKDFKYVCVPERHASGCLHFHLLVGGIKVKELGLTDSGKVCCSWATKKNCVCSASYYERTKAGRILTPTDGLPIYNVSKFCYGFSTATKIVSRERCSWYIQKYVDKNFGSTDMWQKRFRYSKNLVRPLSVSRKLPTREYECTRDMAARDMGSDFSDLKFYNKTYNITRMIFTKEQFEDLNDLLVLNRKMKKVDGELPFDQDYIYKENEVKKDG